MVYYLAQPYTDESPAVMASRANWGSAVAAAMTAQGYQVYAPIPSWHHVAVAFRLPTPFHFWREHALSMIRRCDNFAIITLAGWDRSVGVRYETAFAKECGIPIEVVDVISYRYSTSEGRMELPIIQKGPALYSELIRRFDCGQDIKERGA